MIHLIRETKPSYLSESKTLELTQEFINNGTNGLCCTNLSVKAFLAI